MRNTATWIDTGFLWAKMAKPLQRIKPTKTRLNSISLKKIANFPRYLPFFVTRFCP